MAKYDTFLRYSSVGVGGTVIDLSASGMMGAIYMINRGPNQIFFNFTNVAPVAAFGDGRMMIDVGDAFNLENVQIRYVAMRSVAALADVEFLVTPRPGPGGSGS